MSLIKPHAVEATTGSDLRHRILREATRLFADKGYAATSVREVVEACGCTKPALYYYFRNKEALFVEAIRAETEVVTAIIESHLPTVGSVRDHMAGGLRNYLAHVRGNPMGARLLFRAELQPDEGQPAFDFTTIRTTHMALVRSMLEYGVKNGEIRDDMDLDDATQALVGMVDRWLQEWLRGVPLPENLDARVIRIFFEGVAAKS